MGVKVDACNQKCQASPHYRIFETTCADSHVSSYMHQLGTQTHINLSRTWKQVVKFVFETCMVAHGLQK
jgi:hypothetical protein